AGTHRTFLVDTVVEIDRSIRLIDQRRDVADIDRLMQVDELARLPQTLKELAEILLHRSAPTRARGCWRPWPKLLRPACDHNPGGEGRTGERQEDHEGARPAQARRARGSRRH